MPIDSDILRVIDEVDALRQTHNDTWQIPRVEGELLHQIALSSRARRIVEVGSSYGFSGLWWGAALRRTGGRLITIDVSEKKFNASKATFARAGLADVIENRLGDALEVLASLSGPIDIAFIDADKPSTRAYFDLLWPKMSPGGSVLVDNASTHRAELADYVHTVRTLEGAISHEVAVGNGIEWTIRLA